MRILLCDDDPMILVQMEKYLKEYFQKAHLRVPDIASYTSGDALLRSESTAEIAFLDVEIPGLSGIYTGEKLKKKNPSISIVYASAELWIGIFVLLAIKRKRNIATS